MKRFCRVCSFLLFLALVVSFLPCSTNALSVSTDTSEDVISMEDYFGGFIDLKELAQQLDRTTVPEAVGYQQAIENCHIQRLYSDEGTDLNKVVF